MTPSRRPPDPRPADEQDVPTSVPVAVRPRFAEVVRLTDAACREALDEGLARRARRAAEGMARKRPSPLLGGRAPGRACGIVDARKLPRDIRVDFAEAGYIPWVPADRGTRG